MEYTTIGKINEYVSKSVNPSNSPGSKFEVYSVPSFDTGYPEYLLGSEIASNKQVVQKGDVLLCKINPRINRVWIVADETEYQSIASSEWIVIRSREYTPEFLAWYFRSPLFKKLMVSEVTGIGGSLTRAQPKCVAGYPVPKVDKDVQKQLVATLNYVDKVISTNKQRLVKLDELVKARFIEMFGDPAINEMNWELAPLSTCLQSIDTGTSFVCDAKPRSGTWPAVLKLSAVTYGFYHPEENKAMIDERQFVKDSAVKIGDLLFTRKNTPELVGMCAYVYDTPANLMMPDLIFRLNTSDRCNKVFLWQLINHDLFRGHIRSIATGTAKSMSNISKERLLSLIIILPPLNLQNQFADFVTQVEKSKAAVQSALDKAQLLFDSLMQKYFG